MGSIKEKQCIKLHIVLRKRLQALLPLGRGGTPQGLNKPSIGKICTALQNKVKFSSSLR